MKKKKRVVFSWFYLPFLPVSTLCGIHRYPPKVDPGLRIDAVAVQCRLGEKDRLHPSRTTAANDPLQAGTVCGDVGLTVSDLE